jgi:hypothetical protein
MLPLAAGQHVGDLLMQVQRVTAVFVPRAPKGLAGARGWRIPAGLRTWLTVTHDPVRRHIPVQPKDQRHGVGRVERSR